MPSQASSDATSVANVEDTLNKLWAQVAQTEGKGTITRATTMTLIVYASDPKTASGLIDDLTKDYPCRAILIEVGGPADALTATSTIYCHRAMGGESPSQVCCEEIRLTAGRDAVDRIPSAVEGLILPDLPVYFYHEGDVSLLDPILMHLGEVVDGVIVDSSLFSDAPAGMRSLQALTGDLQFKGRLCDLNWQRLLHWREAMAHSADGPHHEMLVAIRDVEILHRAARAEGLLILGWLASRLKWEIVPGNKDANTWTATAPDGQVSLRLKVMVNGSMGLQKLTLKTQTHLYEIQLSEDNQCLITRDGQVTITPIQPPETLANLIGRAINAQERDLVFEQALEVAVKLATLGHVISQRAGVIVANNTEGLARLAARNFVQTARHVIDRREQFAVALSGGSTPKAVFALLAQSPYRDQVDWMKVHIFWGDERNVPTDHPDSNQWMARETLLDKVPIPPGNIHGILTGTLSAEDAADRYNAEIMAFFGLEAGKMPEFDLILLGMGEDGHTASLFPGTAVLSAPADKIFVANPVPKLQTTRLTLTANAINNAANVVFWVSGAAKTDILAAVLEGPLKPAELPSQIIQPVTGSLTVLADQAAAAKIRAAQRLE